MKYKSRTRLAALLGAPTPPPSSGSLSAEAVAAMVAWWELNEETGVRVDVHGTSDLTEVNTVGFGVGKVAGNAALFNQADAEKLESLDAALNGGARDWTAAAWVNFTANSRNSASIIGKWGDPAKRDWRISAKVGSVNTPAVTIGNGSGTTLQQLVSTDGAVDLDQWHLVVAMHDNAASTLYLQVDNGTLDSVVYSGGTPGTNSNKFNIADTAGMNAYLDGRVDEPCFYAGILDAADRAVLWNGGAGITHEQAIGA